MSTRIAERLVVGALILAIAWFHVWTARTSEPWNFGREQKDYYNLLIDGWLDGQLHLKVDVPAALLELGDPYDPQQRPPGLGLHDASFYRGKYYVYFGVAPVVTLMLPFRLLTGIDLPLATAVLIFTLLAFGVSVWLWSEIRRRYFTDTRIGVAVAVVLVLGLAALGPVLLRRPHMWELPIAAGYFFVMLTLGCVWRSLHAERRRAAWFAGAGLSLALAIASRPTYLLATPLLVAPFVWWWRQSRAFPWRPIAAAVVPLALVGALLALHNYLRFDHPLEFGQRYQFSLDYEGKVTHFSPRYVPFNAWRYLFSAAEWSRYYPFIAPAELPPKPSGFSGHDDVYGVMANLPFAWFALLAPLALWRRTGEERGRMGAWIAAAAVVFVVMAGVLICFFGSLARYLLDFTPTLMLLGGVGVLALERWLRITGPRLLRPTVRALWAAAAVSSAAFGVLFSLQLDGLLRENHPQTERAIALRFNRIPAALERMLGLEHGAIEIMLRFQRGDAAEQTLMTVGKSPREDRVFIRHLEDDRVQFGIVLAGAAAMLSRPVTVDATREHTLRVTLGSLFPPVTHPRFADRKPAEVWEITRQVRLDLDGLPLIDERRRTASRGGKVRIGSDAASEPSRRFRGEVQGSRRVGAADTVPAASADFARMRLAFPVRAATPREPLIAAGDASSGAVIFVHYVDDTGLLAFGSSSDGQRGPTSEPMAVDLQRVHEVSAFWRRGGEPGRRRVELRLDGTIVWVADVTWPERTAGVVFGRLVSSEPGCAPAFTGPIHQTQRGVDGMDPLLAARNTFRFRLQLPKDRGGASEPLLVTGHVGAGDLLAIQYVDASAVRFSLDHWGAGTWTSEVVPIDFGRAHDLEVTLTSLGGSLDARAEPPAREGTVAVRLDGRLVWERRFEFYTVHPDEFEIGRNSIGSTSCGPAFTGEILSVERVHR